MGKRDKEGSGIKNNPGVTKIAILNYLERGPLDGYEIRERLISEFPDVFRHNTKIHHLRRLHLAPLEERGWINKLITNTGEVKYEQAGRPKHFTMDDALLILSPRRLAGISGPRSIMGNESLSNKKLH